MTWSSKNKIPPPSIVEAEYVLPGLDVPNSLDKQILVDILLDLKTPIFFDNKFFRRIPSNTSEPNILIPDIMLKYHIQKGDISLELVSTENK